MYVDYFRLPCVSWNFCIICKSRMLAQNCLFSGGFFALPMQKLNFYAQKLYMFHLSLEDGCSFVILGKVWIAWAAQPASGGGIREALPMGAGTVPDSRRRNPCSRCNASGYKCLVVLENPSPCFIGGARGGGRLKMIDYLLNVQNCFMDMEELCFT